MRRKKRGPSGSRSGKVSVAYPNRKEAKKLRAEIPVDIERAREMSGAGAIGRLFRLLGNHETRKLRIIKGSNTHGGS